MRSKKGRAVTLTSESISDSEYARASSARCVEQGFDNPLALPPVLNLTNIIRMAHFYRLRFGTFFFNA
jgi:hypothetical protein